VGSNLGMLDDAFGHWLAGFIDGEGCFTIMHPRAAEPQLYTRFQLRLRADDRAVLDGIRERVGVGTIYEYEPTARALAVHPGSKASILWVVCTSAGCARLVELLDRFPLRAKKAHDYAIWREAVSARSRRDWPLMDELKAQLESSRRFDVVPTAPLELPTPAQLRLVS
jgi:hypothetical protein